MNYSNEGLAGLFYLHHADSGTTQYVAAYAYMYYECGKDKDCLRVTVLEGSRAAKEVQGGFLGHKKYGRIRKELIDDGTLADDGDCLGFTIGFTKNHTFESASAASCVIRADSSNGLLQWRRASDDKKLGEILRQEYAPYIVAAA